jgi:hypothetical protein
MSKMGSHRSFAHLKHKLWPKEGPGVKLAIWFPTTKSWKSTRSPCVKMVCDIPLERSRQGLQLRLKPHLHWRSVRKAMAPPKLSESQLWQLFGSRRTKNHLDVGPVERCRVYYKGEGGDFPQVRAVVSLVCSNCPWFVLTPKVLQLCTNHLVLVLCRLVWVSKAC